jgi:outer membrane protein OmpA-like peptidoglycan-associated protein
MQSARPDSIVAMHGFILMRAASIARDQRRRGAGSAGWSAIRALALMASSATVPMTDAAVGTALIAPTDRVGAATSRRVDEVHATVTDRSIVLDLGNVRFNRGSAALEAGATANLDWLVALLRQYPSRAVLIEGYVDTRDPRGNSRDLSARRARAVLAYLRRRGIAVARLGVLGNGPADPVASNESRSGRPWKRRIEVVIADAGVDSR